MKKSALMSEQKFNGRRARVGDAVILACCKYDLRNDPFTEQEIVFQAGVVSSIYNGLPVMTILEHGSPNVDPTYWRFVPTSNWKEVESLEPSEWTRPPFNPGPYI